MSVVEYNTLLFEISQRLDELNAGRKLLVMCRGKVAHRSDENMQNVFPLFVELEQNSFLGPDKLEVLKDVLKGVKEWSLFGNVKAFEAKRKEYKSLLEKIIHVLDELDCLEELVAICNDWIPEEKRSSMGDVRSLFKELENNESLGIGRLEVLKGILTQKEQRELLQEVVDLQERRKKEDEFEWRKGTLHSAVLELSRGSFVTVSQSFSIVDFTLSLLPCFQMNLNYAYFFQAQVAEIASSASSNLLGGKLT